MKLSHIAVAAALIAALGLAGNWDMEAEQAEAKLYKDMVCQGNWPDYQGWEPDCD